MRLYFLIYLLAVNAICYALMLYDKKLAKSHRQRIPEKNFFALATIGGSPGCIVGMYTAHHKTRHKSFKFGMPAILLVQLAVCAFIILR